MITISEKALQIYQQAIITDLAVGFEPEIEYPHKWAALDTYLAAGINYVSLHIATDATSLERTIQHIAFINEKIKKNADKYLLVKTDEDIVRAKTNHKLGIGFVFQGTNPIDKKLEMLDVYHQLGVQSMILSYNVRNAIGDGCVEKLDAGLSIFGRKVVERMNQVGIIIDGSHTGRKTSLDAMAISSAPVIFSHSNVDKIYPHPRNLTDEQIKACAATGGIIGINGIGIILGDANASAEKYFAHVDYISQLVGPEHVAIGSDQIYFPEYIEDFLANNNVMYPPNGYAKANSEKNNWTSRKPEQLIEIVELMLQHGYAESAIKGILGENYLRVMRVCKEKAF